MYWIRPSLTKPLPPVTRRTTHRSCILLLLIAVLATAGPAAADTRVVRHPALDVSSAASGVQAPGANVLRIGGPGRWGAYLRFRGPRLPPGRVLSARLRVYKLSSAATGAAVGRPVRNWAERLGRPHDALVPGSDRLQLPARAGRGWIGLDVNRFVRRGRATALALLPQSARLLRLASGNGGRGRAPRLVIRVESTSPAPAPSPGVGFGRRPYSDNSPWNTPIGSSPDVHPRSAAGVAAIGGPREITGDPSQYTYPVFVVDGNTPVRTVQLSGVFSDVRGSGTRDSSMRFLTDDPAVRVPIADNFRAADGSDSQLVIVNPETGDEWGFWRLNRSGSGSWSATNGYHYNVFWDGVPPRGSGGQAFGSRGAGVTYFSGLVRPFEIRRGRIDHALAFAFGGPNDNDYPSSRYVYPASKSDGNSSDPNSLPEGARLQLNPGLSRGELRARGCGRAALVIAKAMQTYGMYVVDVSGSTKIMLESTVTAGREWAALGVERETPSCIPLNAMRWVR